MPLGPTGPTQVVLPGTSPNLAAQGFDLQAQASTREQELLDALKQKVESVYKPGSPTAAKVVDEIVKRYRATSVAAHPKYVAGNCGRY